LLIRDRDAARARVLGAGFQVWAADRKNYRQPSENCTTHNILLSIILTVIEDRA
jgi:hypothetical protein